MNAVKQSLAGRSIDAGPELQAIVRALLTAGMIAMTGTSTAWADGEPARPVGPQGASAHAPVQLAQVATRASAASVQADLEALVKAAKAEGEVLFYTGTVEPVAKRVADSFQAKYGVRASFLRLPGVPLTQRYFTEAEAGNIAADVLFTTSRAVESAEDGIAKGWVESVSKAGIPAIASGEFPARFLPGPTAIASIFPWGVAYNTNRIKPEDLPKDWPDLLNPKFKGLFGMTDPTTGDGYIDFWMLLHEKHGESYFERLRAQNLRFYSGGVPAVQAIGAGESFITFPVAEQNANSLRDKGAPIAFLMLPFTSGSEMQLVLTARARAKHPNAGRLFAHYVLSQEGNKVFSAGGSVSVYDAVALPKEYQRFSSVRAARKDQVTKLLGFK